MKKSFLTIVMLALTIGAAAGNANNTANNSNNNNNSQMSFRNLKGGTNISGQYINLDMNTMLVDNCHGGEMVLLYQQSSHEAMLYSNIEQGFRWKKDSRGGIMQVTRMGMLTSNNTVRKVQGNTGFFTTLDNLVGQHIWTRNILPVYVNDSANVVFGYRAKFNEFNQNYEFHAKNVLYAYRLSDGRELWNDTISHYTRWGWNNVTYLPEKHELLVWADRLYTIDPQKGITHEIVLNTGRYGVPVGVTKREQRTDHNSDADYAFTPYVDRGYYTGIKSNIIFKNGLIYLADGEALYCMDENLDVKWMTQLPKAKTSAMRIRLDGDKITMQSSGMAYLEGCTYNVGKPFVAQFSVSNGTMDFITFPKIDGNITDAHLANGKAYYLTSKGLNEISNLRAPETVVYGKDVIGKVSEIDNHTMYALDGNHMLCMQSGNNSVLLVGKDGTKKLFDTNSGKIVKVEQSNKLYDKQDNVYTCMARNKKGKLTDDASDLIIADANGNVTTHINTPFTGAFYTDGLLTLVMKSGIFTTRL